MFQYDFSNHQNRNIRIEEMPEGYFERIQRTAQSSASYPLWHIAPICGLLNDPCGVFEKDGVHHIFHQWFPAGPVHGLKHWYHLTTRDFVHYEDCGVGMYPDHSCDRFGCYTGMALPEEDAVHIYYTGIRDAEQEPCICLARWDGSAITDRRLILARDPRQSGKDFRDPCVFRRGGKYYLLVGAQDPAGKGVLLLYEGDGPEHFDFRGELDLGGREFGYMLECPNYTDTEDGGLLFFSPMGLSSTDPCDFKNVFSVVYAKGGRLDTERCSFALESFYEMDKGFDFYAPQMWRDGRGRLLLLGWLGNSKSEYPTDGENWAHMLTMPRELTWEGDRLVQTPLPELKALRQAEEAVGGRFETALETCSFELEGEIGESFVMELGNAAGEKVRFAADEKWFRLERGQMSHVYAERFGVERLAHRLDAGQTLRIFADRSSLEIFADNGKTVFTARFFLDGALTLRAHGMNGRLYRLGGIERTR